MVKKNKFLPPYTVTGGAKIITALQILLSIPITIYLMIVVSENMIILEEFDKKHKTWPDDYNTINYIMFLNLIHIVGVGLEVLIITGAVYLGLGIHYRNKNLVWMCLAIQGLCLLTSVFLVAHLLFSLFFSYFVWELFVAWSIHFGKNYNVCFIFNMV